MRTQHIGDGAGEPREQLGYSGGSGRIDLADRQDSPSRVGDQHSQRIGELIERGTDVSSTGVLRQWSVGEVEDIDVQVNGEHLVG